MTEYELNSLKSILDSSGASTNSTELDDKILNAANARAEQFKTKENWFQELLSVLNLKVRNNGFAPAVLSVALTIVVFFALSNLVKVDDLALPDVAKQTAVKVKLETQEPQQENASERIHESDYVEQTPPSSVNARDQILAAMRLPSTDNVLDDMAFNKSADRSLATTLVAQAMTDIQVMIRSGEFNQARDRYDRLRKRCTVCTLPQSLELLVLNDANKISSG